MIASTARNLLEPSTWRRLWVRLGELEEALATTEGDIHERRISRLEAEIAELRAHAGLPVGCRSYRRRVKLELRPRQISAG